MSGLEPVVFLEKGARVMLTMNLLLPSASEAAHYSWQRLRTGLPPARRMYLRESRSLSFGADVAFPGEKLLAKQGGSTKNRLISSYAHASAFDFHVVKFWSSAYTKTLWHLQVIIELFFLLIYIKAMTFLVCILVADNVLLCVKSRPVTKNDHLYECVPCSRLG